ncbi:hypothetical protein ACFTAO_02795 [Paenibacillus rhizoplanae]
MTLLDSNNEPFQVKVAAVTENYVLHYVYMTPAYYTEVFGKEPFYNTQLLNYSGKDTGWESAFGEKLTANGQVALVSFFQRSGRGLRGNHGQYGYRHCGADCLCCRAGLRGSL